jgi:hypothetical protein
MSNLLHYFSSFDKLMKEKLVAPLFWGLILLIGLNLLSEVFDTIGFDVLDSIIDFLNLFLTFLVAFVGIRVLCELAVAIFRINDNLSPDHGVSELADIDPVAEARRAAEDAARRARQGFDSAFEKTQSVTSRAVDSTRASVSKATSKSSELMDDVSEKASAAADSVKTRVKADTTPKTVPAAASRPTAKATTSTAPRKRGRPKGSKNKVRTDPKTGQRLKADGTPARKPGPKPTTAKSGASKSTATKSSTRKASTTKAKGSTAPRKRGRPKGSTTVTRYDPVTGQRLKKDGTPAKKPGPKAK